MTSPSLNRHVTRQLSETQMDHSPFRLPFGGSSPYDETAESCLAVTYYVTGVKPFRHASQEHETHLFESTDQMRASSPPAVSPMGLATRKRPQRSVIHILPGTEFLLTRRTDPRAHGPTRPFANSQLGQWTQSPIGPRTNGQACKRVYVRLREWTRSSTRPRVGGSLVQ